MHQCLNNSIGYSGALDFILAFYVIHEVPNKIALFEEFKNILKPGGKIFIAEPLFHVNKQNFEEMTSIVKQAGFEIIDKPKVFFSRALVVKKVD